MIENPCLKTIFRVWTKMVTLYVALGVIMRVVLAFHPLTEPSSLGLGQWLQVFFVGALNDALVMSVMLVPLMLFLFSSGHWKLRRPQCFFLMGLLVLAWAWVTFGWTTLRQFNASLCRIAGYVLLFWIFTLALRTFIPAVRKWWMRSWTALIIFIYLAILAMNACGVWFFWDEFGVRYNFIAVDYLIYTGEVVGNIMQSYSMGWIITFVILASLGLEWLLFHRMIWQSPELSRKGWRLRGAWVFLPAAAGAILLPLTQRLQHSDNVWCNELQANEAYCFVDAFMKNHLDYRDFYITIPDAEMRSLAATVLTEPCRPDSATVSSPKFIVLITMESMSANFMQRFGNDLNLTPNLDSLWLSSLVFDNMFAAGNRTVRGLEALTLSRPPAPGASIIKRPDQKRYPSIADMLQHKGYSCFFYYGGDSYFDNMGAFFRTHGYQVRDRTTMAPAEISCQTVWGVCDGDVYSRLLADLDKAYTDDTPIFAHILTTSNHRPYIYPEGCVSIPPTQKSRHGAVMYSDYALGQFLREASQRPWHEDAVYVIAADHCASSAGGTELPLGSYHIPALIHAPGSIPPRVVDIPVSQIDLMPTLFGLLGWTPDSTLYGRDILAPCYVARSFLATYQDLGYLQNDTLTVLSPGKKARQFHISSRDDNPYFMEKTETPDSASIKRAAALYQLSGE